MTDLPASTAPTAAAHPLVKGRCPACRGASLFLGSGGYVTCARLDCPNPTAADDLLHGEQPAPAPAATQATDSGPCTCGGRFPLQHLHADQHQQTGNHTVPSRVVHTNSTTPPTENP